MILTDVGKTNKDKLRNIEMDFNLIILLKGLGSMLVYYS